MFLKNLKNFLPNFETIWERSGNQENWWLSSSINIHAEKSSNFMIIIEGRALKSNSEIWLDNIVLSKGLCSNKANSINQIDNKLDDKLRSLEPEKWSKWSDWSYCSVTCGVGFQIKKRYCLNAPCKGLAFDTKHCAKDCNEIYFKKFDKKVDKNSNKYFNSNSEKLKSKDDYFSWSKWSDWTGCEHNIDCNKKLRFRNRYCLFKKNKTNDLLCDGSSLMIDECNSSNCSQSNFQFFFFTY